MTHRSKDGPLRLPPHIEDLDAGDDRSAAIVGGLILEERVDALLQAWIPGYKRLANARDFTFSTKVLLLRATRLVPVKLATSADVVRDVRNFFAHHLDQHQFGGLDEKLSQRIRDAYSSYGYTGERLECPPDASLRTVFGGVVGYAGAGLVFYEANVRALRNAVAQPEVETRLRDEASRLYRQGLDELLRRTADAPDETSAK